MATGFGDAHRIIENRFAGNWNVITPEGVAVLVAYENTEAKRLSDGEEPWVRLSVTEGQSLQIGLGKIAGYHRNAGVVFVSCFVREGTGGRSIRSLLCDPAANIFRGVIDEGVVFRTPSIVPVGVSPENQGWYQANVTTPFQWDLS